MITSYLVALFLTLILEYLVYLLFSFRDKKALLALLGVNLITHPLLGLVVFIWFSVFGLAFSLQEILILEAVIVLLESMLLYYVYSDKYKYFRLLVLSLVANSVSFLFGLLVF